ncbi:MAG: hypothetical protein WDN28_15750 [Chthoniobacter sp.]
MRGRVVGILPQEGNGGSAKIGKPPDYRWLTYATAAITVAVGVSAFEMRSHLLGRFRPAEEQAEAIAGKKETPAVTYDQARQFLAKGDLAKRPRPSRCSKPGPTRRSHRRIGSHCMPSSSISWRDTRIKPMPARADRRARQVFARSRGGGSGDIFPRCGRTRGRHEGITADEAKSLDRRNYEALALLLYGLKDWSLGEYDEASTIFRQYAQVTPDSVSRGWPITNRCLALRRRGECLPPRHRRRESADTLDTRRQALKTVKAAQARIKLANGFAARLDQSAQDLQQKITAEEDENARRIAEREAADTKALAEAKSKAGPLWQQFRPADAYLVMNAVQVTGDQAKQERDALLKKFTWLARFKATLIQDVNTVGYASPVLKKSGTPMPGPIRHANDTQVETATRRSVRCPRNGRISRRTRSPPWRSPFSGRCAARPTGRTPVDDRRLRLYGRKKSQRRPRIAYAGHAGHAPARRRFATVPRIRRGAVIMSRLVENRTIPQLEKAFT